MTILFFGIYDPLYARNRVLREGFERLGHRVVECRVDPRRFPGIRKYVRLFQEYNRFRSQKFDHIIVCFPGHGVMWIARLLFGKRIIFDAFVSLYDSNVFDRKVYRASSLRAWRDWILDKTSCMLAYCVLLDTNAHIEYFTRTFGLSKAKFLRVWIGADDTVFHQMDTRAPSVFTVHFHGSFIPLQGLRYIIEAADVLRNEAIEFRIVGKGQEYEHITSLARELGLSHVRFLGPKPLADIPELLASSHVSLGIFGDTEKTQRVIPNKVYEALAMGCAIITVDTPALRELLPQVQEVCAIPSADPHALAEAIRTLHRDPDERARLGKAARTLFAEQLVPERLVEDLITALAARR